jgi:hypothetical protein
MPILSESRCCAHTHPMAVPAAWQLPNTSRHKPKKWAASAVASDATPSAPLPALLVPSGIDHNLVAWRREVGGWRTAAGSPWWAACMGRLLC